MNALRDVIAILEAPELPAEVARTKALAAAQAALSSADHGGGLDNELDALEAVQRRLEARRNEVDRSADRDHAARLRATQARAARDREEREARNLGRPRRPAANLTALAADRCVGCNGNDNLVRLMASDKRGAP